MDLSEPNPWVTEKSLTRECTPPLRMFCLPYAAAGASVFRDWKWPQNNAPPVEIVPIQLPGRENRWSEPRIENMEQMAQALAASSGMQRLFESQFVLFGHSMGAFIALELARELRRQGLPTPSKLYLSSARAPHLPDREIQLHRMADAELWRRVTHDYGSQSETAQIPPELVPVFVPILRSDLKLCESYRPAPEPPFDFPISVFGGRDDRRVTLPDLLEWSRYTTGTFSVQCVEGGHFHIHSGRERLLNLLAIDLQNVANQRTLPSCNPRA